MNEEEFSKKFEIYLLENLIDLNGLITKKLYEYKSTEKKYIERLNHNLILLAYKL